MFLLLDRTGNGDGLALTAGQLRDRTSMEGTVDRHLVQAAARGARSTCS